MVSVEVEKNPILVFYKGKNKDEMEIPVGAAFKASPYWFLGKKYRVTVERYGGEIAVISGVNSYYFKGVI